MVIFDSYVKLPEGICFGQELRHLGWITTIMMTCLAIPVSCWDIIKGILSTLLNVVQQ